ncbi:MAG: hypothetical protein LBD99_03790 [Candidatus Margulisbacteria bacterium]|jgi:hypothetical protein|nr:hypothetical protein [Candidatus Margulisiibacteriota bacterium]
MYAKHFANIERFIQDAQNLQPIPVDERRVIAPRYTPIDNRRNIDDLASWFAEGNTRPPVQTWNGKRESKLSRWLTSLRDGSNEFITDQERLEVIDILLQSQWMSHTYKNWIRQELKILLHPGLPDTVQFPEHNIHPFVAREN